MELETEKEEDLSLELDLRTGVVTERAGLYMRSGRSLKILEDT